MSSFESTDDAVWTWRLLYTKRHAEIWVDANLRKQGFQTLLPRAMKRQCMGLLFPRYIFACFRTGQRGESMAGTYGVQYVVMCGDRPTIVPEDVIQGIRARMDGRGVVALDRAVEVDPMFAKTQRERVYALTRFAQAGFRVRAA